MNLCRQLTAALLVAVFGAIIIGGGGNSAGVQAKLLNIAEIRHVIFAYRLVFAITAIGIVIAFFRCFSWKKSVCLAAKRLRINLSIEDATG